MRNEKPKKALFIVHRELIARQALKSYKKVFGSMKKLALLSGKEPELFQVHQRFTLTRFPEREFFNQLTVQERTM